MRSATYYALFMEYETTDIPLIDFALKRFGYDKLIAERKARESAYPFPCYRLGGQKSPWFISIEAAAKFIDDTQEQAKRNHERVNNQTAA